MPAFPTFANGATVHLPYTQETEYWNTINRQPHGYQYSYNILASGMKRWEIQFTLSDADLSTLETFWAARKGCYEEFTFTDPDTGATTSKCRFDQESLSIQYIQPNENRVSVTIQEYK